MKKLSLTEKRSKADLRDAVRTLTRDLLDNHLTQLSGACAAVLAHERALVSYSERVGVLGKQLSGQMKHSMMAPEALDVPIKAMTHMVLLLENQRESMQRARGRAMSLETWLRIATVELGLPEVQTVLEQFMSEVRDEAVWSLMVTYAVRTSGVDKVVFAKCGTSVQ